MKKFLQVTCLFILFASTAYAQPANDACSGAQSVTPNNTCYAGTTVGAADNWVGTVGCQSGNNAEVWYSFVATNSQLNVTVTEGTMGGNVEFILVASTAACTGLTITGSLCGASPLTGVVNGLQVGTTYYYTISSSGATGTFTTCVNNIAPVPVAGQDCNSAAILCDDSPFSQAASNAGFGIQEVNTTNSCWGGGGERQSKWFKFSVGCSGTLEFRITPNVLTNDYDWAVWDITTDPTGCTTKGNSIACDWSGCTSSTGMTSCNPITLEPSVSQCGGAPDPCGGGTRPRAWYNWSAGNTSCLGTTPITVTCGRYYALLVDNYTTSNNGFTLTWGGACNGGTAVIGPDPSFTLAGTNCGQIVTVTKTCCTSANFTYLWNFGDGFTSTLPGPITHTYSTTGSYIVSLTVTDQFGCSKVSSQTISGAPIASTTAQSNVLCNGASTGAATVTPTNGSPTFTYSWTPGGQTTQTATGLPAGTYTVNITDATGCVGTNTVTITQPATPLTATQSQANLTCNAVCTGTASVAASGGTGAYTYSWSPSGGTGSSATALCAGNYTCTIKDANLCVTIKTFTITQPTAVTAVATQTNTCSGTCNGISTVTPSGGSPGYTYTWSPSGGNSSSASSLCAGNYTVTIKDLNNCAITSTVTIAPIPTPTVLVNSATICSGTSATLTASGATNYTWTPSGGLSATTGSVVTANPASTTVYTLTGTTAGCSGSNTATVTVNTTPTVTVNSATICSGTSATLTASGAANYTWTPSGGLSATTGSVVTANPSSSTTYTVTGTTSGCSNANTSILTVNPTPTLSVNNATICPGATATLTASGAVTYSWSPATGLSSTSGATVTANPTVTTTYTLTGNNASCSSSTTTTVTVVASLNVLVNSPAICSGSSGTLNASGASSYTWSPAGGLSSTSGASVTANPTVTTTYTVIGTAGSCSSTATSTVTVNPSPNSSATATPTVICSGSSSTLNASGASSYTWSTGSNATSISVSPGTSATYTLYGSIGSCLDSTTVQVTVTPLPTLTVTAAPASICSGQSVILSGSGATTYTWSANAGSVTTNTATVSPGTTDTFTLTGNNSGCTATETVTVNVTPTPTLSINATPANICMGQSSVLSISGATTYTWSANAGSVSTSTVSVTPATTDTYTVTGDNSGCITTATVAVTVTPLPSLTITATPATICTGQSSVLTGSGAGTYTWSANAGSVNTNTVSVSPGSSTTYTLIGTQGGCTDSTMITVSVGTQPTLSVSATQTAICTNQNVTLNASGATNYSWTPFASTGSSTSVILTSTTTFTLVGSNSGGCIDSTTITIIVNPVPTLTITPASASICNGQSIVLSVSGATTYTWGANAGSANTTTVSVSPSVTTPYSVSGTDANGCTNNAATSVTVNPLPVVNAGPDQTVCNGNSVTLSGSGAVTYTWTGGVTNGVPFNPSANGTYTVAGTDANGCSNIDMVNVVVNQLPVVNAGVDQTVCSGTSVTLSGSGATTYTWTGGVTNGTPFTPGSTNSYTVSGTDANGCTNTDVVNVTVNPTPVVSAGNGQTVCSGSSVTLSGSGANTYTWSGGITNGVPFTPTITVTYTVTGTGAAGCTNTAVVTVTVNQLPNISGGPDQTVCAGNTITLNGSGGVLYNWTGGTNNGVPFTPASSGAYTVTGVDANGCSNTDVVNITVNQLPVVNAGADQAACAGNTITLSGSGALTYTWTGGVTNGTPFNPTTGSYTVSGMDANGCTNTDVVNVTVNPLPTVNSGGAVVMPCGANSFTLSGTSNATTPVYSWSGPGIVSGSNTATPVINAAGSYTLTVTDNATGCSDTSVATVTTNTLSVGFTPDVTSGYSPLGVNFTNTSVNATSFNWVFGNGNTSTAPNPSNTFTGAGTYTVMLIGTNGGCLDTAFATILVLENSSITAPNIFSPNGDNINDVYFFTAVGIKELNADIFNRWGSVVGKISGVNGGWDGRTLKGENASEGTYFYVLTAQGYDGKKYEMHGSFTLVR